MKRTLLALLVLLLAAVAVLPFWRAYECPDCVGAPPPGPVDGILTWGYFTDCPRCDDAGRVTVLNRWFRKGLHPDLLVLLPKKIGFGTVDGERELMDALRRRVAAADPSREVSGVSGLESLYVRDGDEAYLAVAVCGQKGERLRYEFFLFERGGALLDHAEVGVPVDGPDFTTQWRTGEGRRSECSVLQQGSKPAPFSVRHRGAVETRPGSEVRLRVSKGAFEVLKEEAR